ncbi:MAG: peptidoglycan DD-metalloendopeptidase family protein [Carboxydocellales bacterium]
MALSKQDTPKQGNSAAIVGGCAVLLMVANILTAFANGSQNAVELQGQQSKMYNRVGAALEKKVTAAGIIINNKLEVVLANEKEAQEVLQQLQSDMIGRTLPQTKVQIKYDENIEITQLDTQAGKVLSVPEAVALLKIGRVEVVTYTVKDGENLWTIARKNDMRVQEIRDANPGLSGDSIDIGQVINLVKPEPLIHIVATIENTVKAEIPFGIKYEVDKSLKRGAEKIKQPGKKGNKSITYRTVMRNGVQVERKILAEKVLAKPVLRVVASGRKREVTMLASRGEDGSGDLIWPIRGPINSGFGDRWGRRHTGLDIGGPTGESVKAADSGRVVFAGWDGEYGKMVTIDNGGGITTRYAHLSSFGVNEGDEVGRGDYIGKVGTTGRTTGPHLHFEVLKNGDFRNPLGYLR